MIERPGVRSEFDRWPSNGREALEMIQNEFGGCRADDRTRAELELRCAHYERYLRSINAPILSSFIVYPTD